jgi:pimeloyl-ACP methyl ester carboxylesterase
VSAARFSRWCASSAAVIAACAVAIAHPHHNTTAEAAWNASERTLEVSLRLPPEDIEAALRASDDSIRIDPPTDSAEAALRTYLQPRFTASGPGDTAWEFRWVGFETDERFTLAHFALAAPPEATFVRVTNAVLLDVVHHDHDHAHGEQMNTVVVRLGEGDAHTFTATAADPSEEIPLPAVDAPPPADAEPVDAADADGGAPARAVLAPIERITTFGEGPVRMIFIPGLASDERVFQPLLDRAGERYTIHVVVIPGFGGTAPPPAPKSEGGTPWMDNAVDAIAALVREREWNDAILVGHSMGGHLVFRLLAEHPGLFRGGISIDGFAAIPLSPAAIDADARRQLVETGMKPSLVGLHQEAWDAQIDAVMLQVKDPGRRSDLRAMMRQTQAPIAGRYMAEYMASDAIAQARSTNEPVGVIACINDDMRARSIDREALRRIWEGQLGEAPMVRVRFLENAPHMAMEDHAAEIGSRIGAFVDRLEAEAVKTSPTP